jgi:hypothetical protein
MRKRLSDPRVVASGVSAVDNIRQFIELKEFADVSFDVRTWNVALQVAADLAKLCKQHAAERLTGVRRW